ncbi:MAG: hypothetical protein HY063_11065 [Bacteroidetes bacterium]|nr:hypothetical protein [Bacteroidota bacterium]
MPVQDINDEEKIFNPQKMGCCVDISGFIIENLPQKLINKLAGKPISEGEDIIKEFFNPKEKMIIKWSKK